MGDQASSHWFPKPRLFPIAWYTDIDLGCQSEGLGLRLSTDGGTCEDKGVTYL
jgi:hypothetical protein